MRTSSVRIVRLNKLCADVAFLQQVRMSGYFILFQLWKLASLTPLAIGYLCSSRTKKKLCVPFIQIISQKPIDMKFIRSIRSVHIHAHELHARLHEYLFSFNLFEELKDINQFLMIQICGFANVSCGYSQDARCAASDFPQIFYFHQSNFALLQLPVKAFARL